MNGHRCKHVQPTGKACGRPACVHVPSKDEWSCWIHAPPETWHNGRPPIPCRPTWMTPGQFWRPSCVVFPGRCNWKPAIAGTEVTH